MNGSRLAETVSFHSMFVRRDAELGGDELADLDVEAVRVARRALRPNSGWSNLVPTVIVPASVSVGHRGALVERRRRFAGVALPPSACWSPESVHAAERETLAAARRDQAEFL